MSREAALSQAIQQQNLLTAWIEAEKLIKETPSEPRYHMIVGKLEATFREQDRDRSNAYEKVLQAVPEAFTTRLLHGLLLLEQNAEVEVTYRILAHALKGANSVGFWLNDASTPPWCRPLVVSALNFVEKHRRTVMNDWIADYEKRYSAAELSRVIKGIRMYSGEQPLELEDERQRPSFFYVPGLPAKPVFDRNDLSFIEYYESQYELILADLEAILAANTQIENYRDDGKHGLTKGGDWDALFFYRHGNTYQDTHDKSPNTSSVLAQLPIVHIPEHSPEICFSVLRPGAHILPHRGVTNTRSVLHMGLKIPADCALNIIGIDELHWQPGKVFAFDDTYEHEAWNRSDESRYVLLADIWNPFLTDAEREVITDFVVKVGHFNKL